MKRTVCPHVPGVWGKGPAGRGGRNKEREERGRGEREERKSARGRGEGERGGRECGERKRADAREIQVRAEWEGQGRWRKGFILFL